MLYLFMISGIPKTTSSDNETNFTSQLNREFLKRLGCSPRFNTPGHPDSSGLFKRMVGTLKNVINKVDHDHLKQGYLCQVLREIPSQCTGAPPWVLSFGQLSRGRLAMLKEIQSEEVDYPLDLSEKQLITSEICRINCLWLKTMQSRTVIGSKLGMLLIIICVQ